MKVLAIFPGTMGVETLFEFKGVTGGIALSSLYDFIPPMD